MFTRTEKLAELEREIAMRKRVYPRFVEQKKMTQVKADRQVALMEEIADDYRTAAETANLLREAKR